MVKTGNQRWIDHKRPVQQQTTRLEERCRRLVVSRSEQVPFPGQATVKVGSLKGKFKVRKGK
jgi:hypothetical protein